MNKNLLLMSLALIISATMLGVTVRNKTKLPIKAIFIKNDADMMQLHRMLRPSHRNLIFPNQERVLNNIEAGDYTLLVASRMMHKQPPCFQTALNVSDIFEVSSANDQIAVNRISADKTTMDLASSALPAQLAKNPMFMHLLYR